MQVTKSRALAFAFALALAACSGSTGPQGSQGAAGQDGAAGKDGSNGSNGKDGAPGKDATALVKAESCEACHYGAGASHQAVYNEWVNGLSPKTSRLSIKNVTLTVGAGSVANTYKATVRFQLLRDGLPFIDTTNLGALKQKTFYFVTYDSVAGKFPTPAYVADAATDPTGEKSGSDAGSVVNFSFSGWKLDDATQGFYTATKDKLSADPVAAATNAFIYAYFGDKNLDIPANTNTKKHYALMDNMISFAQVVKGAINYTSTIDVANCEKCHGKPYSKHGYRQASIFAADGTTKVLPDFAACKACHTDFRRGTDGGWYMLVDDQAGYAAQGETLTDAQKAKYAYVANIMNDTHNSHAFEFAYPQSMANCVTCHAASKLSSVLSDANFKVSTCKSCHPVTGKGGTSEKRAPSFAEIFEKDGGALAQVHAGMDMYTTTADCTLCHKDGGVAKTFAQIHTGYDKQIYNANGQKYSATVQSQIVSATYDATAHKVTVKAKVTGAAAQALVKPTVVLGLYGYGSKDFVVSGHGSAADGKRNLEWTEASSSNSARLAVAPATATAGNANWTITADLTLWADKIDKAPRQVDRIEVAFLPVVGLDQTKAVSTDNPAISVGGANATVDLYSGALATGTRIYGKDIVDASKCNNCHNELGMTFHSPSYGSAGVVGCRTCHAVPSGSSHLEMQSRSIDSFVHAVHSFQFFDIKNVDFADAAQKMEYEEHIDSEYPNFTLFSCESCHAAGKYEVPDQSKSLASLVSASQATKNWDRNIGTVPSYVMGPGARACGSCHRAKMINEDDASRLESFYAHTASFSTQLEVNSSNPATTLLESTWAQIQALFQ